MTNQELHHAKHAAAHGDVSHGQSTHGSRNSYIIGFILSAILTVIPFWLIMSQTLAGMNAVWMIAGFAAAQIAVQVFFFLHVDFSPEQRNTLYSFLFTVFVVAIVMAGSLWIMHNANENMMPGMGHMGHMNTEHAAPKRLDRELEGFEDKLGVPPAGQGTAMPSDSSNGMTNEMPADYADMSNMAMPEGDSTIQGDHSSMQQH